MVERSVAARPRVFRRVQGFFEVGDTVSFFEAMFLLLLLILDTRKVHGWEFLVDFRQTADLLKPPTDRTPAQPCFKDKVPGRVPRRQRQQPHRPVAFRGHLRT